MEKVKKSIEQHSFKISIWVAVIVIIFLTTMTYNFSNRKATMEAKHLEIQNKVEICTTSNATKIEHIGEKVVSMRAELAGYNEDNSKLTAEYLSMKVDMQWIKTSLLKIEGKLN